MTLRFSPSSLATRMTVILATTLVASQAVNYFVFAEQRRTAVVKQAVNVPIERFVEAAANGGPFETFDTFRAGGPPPGARSGAERRLRGPGGRLPPRDQIRAGTDGRNYFAPVPQGGSIWLDEVQVNALPSIGYDAFLTDLLEDALANANVPTAEMVLHYGPVQMPGRRREPPPDVRLRVGNDAEQRPPELSLLTPPYELRISVKLADSQEWLNARFRVASPPARVDVSTLVLNAIIVAGFLIFAVTILALSITKPLKDLSKGAARLGKTSTDGPLSIRGPDEVQQAILAFNDMNARVTELLNEKDVMLGALGHDLRTPLTSLRLRIERMGPDESRNQAIHTLDEMARLIEDILELARTNAYEREFAVYDIRSIVHDVIADYQEMGSNVVMQEMPRIAAPCRPGAIERLLRNLTDNALKHAGSACVDLRKTQEAVQIIVEDDGPGVSETELTSLLQPFERGEQSRSRSTGGSGLGLAIARAVARAHGGDLTLSNRTPKGLRATAEIRSKLK